MFGITDLPTYLLGTLFIVLLRAPIWIYVLSVAAQRGVRAGFQAASGVFVGDAILMLLSATGVASILHTLPALFILLKYVGAAYLGWIGLNMLRAAWRGRRHPAPASLAPAAAPMREQDSRHPMRKALVISLLNPKAILFFISFFIQFVDPAYPYPALTFLALGAIVQLFSLSYLTLLVLLGVRVADGFRRRRKLAASMTGGVGALFVGFGAKLASASLN